MNAEQLNSARLARWSQNGEARLTLEAAAEWLAGVGFCPYLPAGPAGGPPAPSFLEAVVGRPAQAPSAGERSRAMELLARLIENSSVVPLKLGSSLGEQPDFVSSPDVLRYIYALRGDRNFKTGPLTVGNEKVTPLSLHCWQAIEQQGPMDVAALQPILGRDMTEAAISRALQELWSGLYISPALSATGQPAQWDLLFRRFPKQVAAGACTGHAEALSAMISLYLQTSVAALEEEILTFLSPLAPQSKLREVIRGLGSMRQLDILDISGRSHVALEGGLLPEMVAQLSEQLLAASATNSTMESESETESGDGIVIESGIEIEAAPQPSSRPWKSQPLEDSDKPARFAPKKFAAKKFTPRHADAGRPTSGKFAARASGDRRSARASDHSESRPGAGGFSRPAGSYAPRPRSFAAGAEDRPRGGRPGSTGAGRSGPARSETGRFGRDRDAGASRGPGSRGRADRGSKAPERKGYAAKGRGLGERAKRWQKSGEVPEAPSSGSQPFAPKPSGFKSGGFKPGASKFGGSKSFGTKPWQSKSRAPGGGASEERPKPWKKFDAAGGARAGSRAGSDMPYTGKSHAKSAGWKAAGFKPRAARPWAAKSSDDTESSPRGPRGTGPRSTGERPKMWQRSGSGADARPAGRKPYARKPSGFTTSGFKSAGSKSAENRSAKPRWSESRPATAKPWASKGAAARVGSARSYADRSSAKPYAKAGGAKPWAKRSSAASEGGESRPKRRLESSEPSDTPSGKKAGAKPFWAKNPRGGKGSAAASRTNRPRGNKAGRKSGKKK